MCLADAEDIACMASCCAIELSLMLATGSHKLAKDDVEAQHTDLHPVGDAGGLHMGSCVDSIAEESEPRVGAPHD